MKWNWQLPNWPAFTYNPDLTSTQEKQFLLHAGGAGAFLKKIEKSEYNQFIVEILSQEGTESSKIEGEILDRESLQSSIKRHFGLQKNTKREKKKEAGMADLLCDVYNTYQQPLTHQMLWNWHSMLFKEQFQIDDHGKYRTHMEPMQIVSNRFDVPKVIFEAPPSKIVQHEMKQFINWFNASNANDPILGKAAVAHVYFESIHPFEDGNGRIGRAIVEKMLSQSIGRPVLIAISKVLEYRKKEYYAALEKCNRTLKIDSWVEFFSEAILQAEKESATLLNFLIEKSKMMNRLKGLINPRQEKVLLRMFESGPEGFKGGLSAENYIKIADTSRATATRDLADLLELKALTKTGELRHTRYWLNLHFAV